MEQTISGATTLADRAVLRLGGAEARPFLQGLVTQDVVAVGPETPRWAGLLTPQGKALFDMILWDAGEDLLLDVEASQAEAIARRLATYRLRRAVTIDPVRVAVHWSPETVAGRTSDPRLPALGRRWLGPAGEAATGWRAHRLALGVTEGVAELGQDRTLWLECNAAELGGVSFAKGCYVGQENTARMHYRAKVSRRLIVAPIAPVGERTRACYPELGLMVEHRRVDALGDAMVPDWLRDALADGSTSATTATSGKVGSRSEAAVMPSSKQVSGTKKGGRFAPTSPFLDRNAKITGPNPDRR